MKKLLYLFGCLYSLILLYLFLSNTDSILNNMIQTISIMVIIYIIYFCFGNFVVHCERTVFFKISVLSSLLSYCIGYFIFFTIEPLAGVFGIILIFITYLCSIALAILFINLFYIIKGCFQQSSLDKTTESNKKTRKPLTIKNLLCIVFCIIYALLIHVFGRILPYLDLDELQSNIIKLFYPLLYILLGCICVLLLHITIKKYLFTSALCYIGCMPLGIITTIIAQLQTNSKDDILIFLPFYIGSALVQIITCGGVLLLIYAYLHPKKKN